MRTTTTTSTPEAAADVIRALLDADGETPQGRPRLSREAIAYLRGAADALAALDRVTTTQGRPAAARGSR